MIESDLVAHLKADTALTALVSTRIYPMTAPQNVVKPYITYQVISDNSNQCVGGQFIKAIHGFSLIVGVQNIPKSKRLRRRL